MRLDPSRKAVALAAALLFAGLCSADEITSFSRRSPIVEAVQKTKSAIVTVKVPRPGGGKDMVGTGVIIDERGYIVTNRHVVGACRQPNIRLHDGTVIAAEVVFAEARWDLAVLRITTTKTLHHLPLIDTDDLMVGETVIAVGHPYGYTNTVSRGIVSALDREITMPTGDVLTGLIQTDASINPGNSGGPLLNINGELIGINCALRDGANGIAFAINAGTVKTVLSKVLSAQRMAGVNHGLACKEKIVGETRDRQRVVVASFQGDVLRAGDEIRTIGARSVINAFDVERSLWDNKPGDTVQLKVVRDGRAMVVELTLTASPGAGVTAGAPITDAASVAQAPRARIVGASER
jgi:serine protease Do